MTNNDQHCHGDAEHSHSDDQISSDHFEGTTSGNFACSEARNASAAGRHLVWRFSTECSFGWYDLTLEVESDPTFRQRLAGHVETGQDSVSDPALGG